MKRRAFLRELTQAGCRLKRRGGRHDLYENPKTGRVAPIPRHSEIGNTLCELIRKQLAL